MHTGPPGSPLLEPHTSLEIETEARRTHVSYTRTEDGPRSREQRDGGRETQGRGPRSRFPGLRHPQQRNLLPHFPELGGQRTEGRGAT